MSTVNSRDTLRKQDLLYLLYRVGEPLHYPKGETNERCYFELSPDYLTNRYQEKATVILNRFSGETDGRRIDIAPLLKDALLRIPLNKVQVVKRRDQFSLFIPQHQKAAGRLISIFMGLKSVDDLMAFAAYARDRVNAQLYAYVLSTVLVHREDTKNLRIPSSVDIFPEKFVDYECITESKEIAEIFPNPNDRIPVEISRDFSGNDSDPEHRLAYFREDLGVNLHHWHWHLIYPFDGPDIMIRKDRRGELFCYLHREILARYNIERLCNNLDLVRRLLDWNEPIEEAYFSMLNTTVAGKDWPSRPANMRLSNINRPDRELRFDIEDLVRYKERIYEAIHRKKVIDFNGDEIDIDNERGIDILGNIVEASTLTPNANYYGNLHNMGHLAIAFIHDPKYRYNQTAGIMSDTNTAMRDPVFYRWHAFIDDIFIEHKNTLTPYDVKTLTFPGIRVSSVELCTVDDNQACRAERNVLNTFMMKTDINLSRGLDFTPRGPVLARVTHLNHDQFRYNIRVKNSTGKQVHGTVRIFMCPSLGFDNLTINLQQQKNLMIEMDRFVAILEAGDNTIVRQSTQSSVTIPFEQTFRDLNINRPDENDVDEFNKFNYCGCGWPQHMLVPKGTPGGYPMLLFAMISDYSLDRVDTNNDGPGQGCRTGVAFCGLRDKLYPDKRPMGYPFDRPLRSNVDTLEDFKTPNMAFTPITIVHSNEVREGNLVSESS